MKKQNTGRVATVERTTKETSVKITLNLDGTGKAEVETGIGFFNHMLEGLTRHSFMDADILSNGDLEVDCHHTIEDTGLTLGKALREALGNKEGIRRFGSAIVPMDDALVLCAIDLSGRPYLNFEVPFTVERIGDFDTEMAREFFLALSNEAGMNVHIKLLAGQNNHHICECAFKAFARALADAVSYDPRVKGILTTKGAL